MPGAIIQVLQARDGVLFFLATVDKTKTKGGAEKKASLIYDKSTLNHFSKGMNSRAET